MTKWTIRNRIVGSFGIVLALMIASAGVAYTRLAGIERETKSLRTDSLPGLSYSIAAQDAWSRNFLLLEEYVRQPDAAAEGMIEPKRTSSRQELDKAISNYGSTPTTPEERRLFEAFKSAKADFMHGEEAILANAAKNRTTKRTGRQDSRDRDQPGI